VTPALARSEARLRQSERLVSVGSWELALGDSSITFSDGFARLLGLVPGTELDMTAYERLVHPDDLAIVRESIQDCVASGAATCEYRVLVERGEERTLLVHGERVSDQDGPRFLRGAILDVTHQRVSERERVEALSLFQDGFDGAPIGMVLTAPVHGGYVRVNDAMCRMLGRTREELLALEVDDVTHPDDRLADAEAWRAMTDGSSSHFQTEKRYLHADGSVVWAVVHVTPVRRADGSPRAFFSQVMDITERKGREAQLERDVNEAVWLGRIRDAIDEARLVLYSQPIVDLVTGRTVQHELLLRMRGEDGSIIAPGAFLPVAERYGLISEVDRWVIRRAAAVAATGVPTEFNLSARSICDPDVLREIELAIADSGVDPSLLIVEVTETAMVDHLDAGRAFAERVTALGCQLALDDFGTGFGSLSYLKHIPVQHLKIDMEFVQDLTGEDADERVVRAIVGLASEFDNQTTTAEGVEDHATLQRLRELGVHRAQGYLLGRPQLLPDLRATGNGAEPFPFAATPASDALAVVRAAFDAFAERDIDTILELCDPDVAVRPVATLARAGRSDAYRGYDGVRAYFRDVADVWADLRFETTAFREGDGSVIVFGNAHATVRDETAIDNVLWIWRLRSGRVASMDVFRTPAR
jgi:PAS domain S-box-containing protein